MNWVFWIGGLLLFAVAAYSVYWAFRSPKFIGRLTKYASKQVWKAVQPEITRPMPAEEQAQWRAAERAGRGEEFMRKRRGAPPKG